MRPDRIDDLLKEMMHDAEELIEKIEAAKKEMSLDHFDLDLDDINMLADKEIWNDPFDKIEYRNDVSIN